MLNCFVLLVGVRLGVEQFGLHFESVGQPDLGPVTDLNKTQFVSLKIENILMNKRLPQLTALKKGFVDALSALSEEAAPFLSLLSHTDWRVKKLLYKNATLKNKIIINNFYMLIRCCCVEIPLSMFTK